MPSPPRPAATARTPQELALQQANSSLRAATTNDGPWGRRHLAFAMRRQAHWFEGGPRPCAPGGACEGKMPSPPRPVATARAFQELAPQKAHSSLRATATNDGPWGRGHLALAMRRKAHWFEGGSGQARLAARARARCPRPQGPVAIPRARQELALQKAHGSLRAAASNHGPWGRRHLAFAVRR